MNTLTQAAPGDFPAGSASLTACKEAQTAGSSGPGPGGCTGIERGTPALPFLGAHATGSGGVGGDTTGSPSCLRADQVLSPRA